MGFLRTRRFLIAALVLVLGVPATWLLARDKSTGEDALVSQVKRGDFRVTVTTSGELRAPKFVQVTLPPNAMQAQVFNLKIASLVPEGTLVKDTLFAHQQRAIQCAAVGNRRIESHHL